MRKGPKSPSISSTKTFRCQVKSTSAKIMLIRMAKWRTTSQVVTWLVLPTRWSVTSRPTISCSLTKYLLEHLRFISWVWDCSRSYRVWNGQASLLLSRDAKELITTIRREMIFRNMKPCSVSTENQKTSSNSTKPKWAEGNSVDFLTRLTMVPICMIIPISKMLTALMRNANTRSLEDKSASESAPMFSTEFGKRL